MSTLPNTLIDRSRTAGAGLLAAALLAPPAAAEMAERPMYYLETNGIKGRETAELLWGLSLLSIAVVVIITVLVVAGTLLKRSRDRVGTPGYLNISNKVQGRSWIYLGTGISTVVLVAFVWWTFTVFEAIAGPSSEPEITIEITAHQWWWEATYVSGAPNERFETANEIHIPVGEPVRIRLRSADVIHSFWVPKLSGKTDAIPGRSNVTWLQADEPGVYRGQCAEYCLQQHAHMQFYVIAHPKREYLAWRDHQLEPANPPESEGEIYGRKQFLLRCSACHTVRGTRATGKVGPDLTHLMSRGTLAAGMLDNNIGNLSGWIANPQNIKPGSFMPNVEMSGPELNGIRNYLLTLE